MSIVVVGSVFIDIKGFPTGVYIPAGRNVGRIEEVHGGVARNVVENIANVGLRPRFVSLVDDNGAGEDVIKKLNRHDVDTTYTVKHKDGMGTWLAVFNSEGDVVASISKRCDLMPITEILDEDGHKIFADCESCVVEFDMEVEILERVLYYAEVYGFKIYAIISNMSIAVERRGLLKKTDCIVCNLQEAEILFQEDFSEYLAEQMADIIYTKIKLACIPKMVVTMGEDGAIYATLDGERGYVPPRKVDVIDTTGAGDAFFSGVAIGLTYNKSIKESCEIGTRLASAVIGTLESTCPRFMPQEFDLDI